MADRSLPRSLLALAGTLVLGAGGCASVPLAPRAVVAAHLGCHAALRLKAPLWSSASYDSDGELVAAAQAWADRESFRERSVGVREAEEQACTGLAEADLMTNPLFRREDVVEVTRVLRQERFGAGGELRTVALLVRFHPVPGLTRDWMAEALRCHTVRDRAARQLGGAAELFPMSMASDAQVDGDGSELAVRVAVRDERDARALLRLARPRSVRYAR